MRIQLVSVDHLLALSTHVLSPFATTNKPHITGQYINICIYYQTYLHTKQTVILALPHSPH